MTLLDTRVIPVLRGNDPERVYELAHLLLSEGFSHLELTYTVPDATNLIARLAALPGAVVGAGTVLKREQFEEALSAGARFIVSPGLAPGLLETARAHRATYIPGVFTPSDVMGALEHGFGTLKLFPGSVGGPEYLQALRGPFPDVHFMPTGGVDITNIGAWAEAGAVAVGMGSSLTRGTPEAVRSRARELRLVLDGLSWS